jgi:hypothetical protein
VRARRPSRMDISGLETRRRHIPVLRCLLKWVRLRPFPERRGIRLMLV